MHCTHACAIFVEFLPGNRDRGKDKANSFISLCDLLLESRLYACSIVGSRSGMMYCKWDCAFPLSAAVFLSLSLSLSLSRAITEGEGTRSIN